MDGRELKAYQRFKEQSQVYRARCYDLESEVRVMRPELHRAHKRIDQIEQQCDKLAAENRILKQKLADLSAELKGKPAKETPSFVKPNAAEKTPKKPGGKKGHPPAFVRCRKRLTCM